MLHTLECKLWVNKRELLDFKLEFSRASGNSHHVLTCHKKRVTWLLQEFYYLTKQQRTQLPRQKLLKRGKRSFPLTSISHSLNDNDGTSKACVGCLSTVRVPYAFAKVIMRTFHLLYFHELFLLIKKKALMSESFCHRQVNFCSAFPQILEDDSFHCLNNKCQWKKLKRKIRL